MKYVFTVQTSHDGLMPAVFTNIKALFDYLNTDDFNAKSISIDRKDVAFTYANLVKSIRQQQKLNRFHVAYIDDHFDGKIDICDLIVKSK